MLCMYSLIAAFVMSLMTLHAQAGELDDSQKPLPGIHLITLDPGHFHASLVQKSAYQQVCPEVNVYAPEGDDLQQHLKRIDDFNTRAENPTHWREKVYSGPDYLERMTRDKPGKVVVISGNNTRKTEYIGFSVLSGMNVL